MSDEVTDPSDFDAAVDFDIPGFDTPKPAESATTEETPPAAGAEAAATEAASPEEQTANAEANTPQQQAADAVRKLKLKAGDREVELEENAQLEWKVDGKPTPVTVRELLDNYAGKVAYEKRFQQVANDRKAYDADRKTFEAARDRQKSLVLDMYEKTKAGKTFEAVQSLIDMTGLKVDARDYVKQLRESLIGQAKQLAEMSDEQRAVHELNEERDYLKAQYAKLSQQREQEEAQKAFQTRLATVAEQNGVPYDEFAQTHEWLRQQVRANNGDPNTITPEYVVEHRRNLKAYEVARDAIAAVEPELVRDGLITDEARWDKLAQLAKAHPEIDAQEFAQLYRDSRQKKNAVAAAKKLEKAPVSTPAKASIRKPKDVNAEALDFSKISADDAIW